MYIDYQRAFTPAVMRPEECGLCRRTFRVQSVVAIATTDDHQEIGWACSDCVRYFGEANPECFISLKEFEELLRRYPEPIWGSGEEAEEAELAGYDINSTFVWQAPL